ncbi:MAG: Ig-like domain-containing protein [Planctomycetaceae bacterium]|jgi:ABC-type glycerol-3-phosphate transport system substrate-binding protein|nr:Ig-like domain-containing protein [Planctomycetaceae bacterium]
MIKNKNIFILSLGALFFVAGCGDSAKPKDLPKLYPVTITVTSEGTPLENAVVELVSDPPLKFQAITGTDANGKAVMKTYN